MEHQDPITLHTNADDVRSYDPSPTAGAITVGIGCFVMFSFGILLSLGILGIGHSGNRWSLVPCWVLAVPGGAALIIYGVILMVRSKRINRERQLASIKYKGRQPWAWDHDWQREQCLQQFWKRAIRNLIGAVISGLLVMGISLPIAIRVIDDTHWNYSEMIVASIFVVIGLAVVGSAIAMTAGDFVFRGLRIHYARTPFFTGDPIQIQVQLPQHIANPVRMGKANTTMEAQLRLIQEKIEIKNFAEDNPEEGEFKKLQIWAQKIQVGNLEKGIDERGCIVLNWDVPKELAGNDLVNEDISSWQLVLQMKHGIFSTKQHYLVPIYKKEYEGMA